MVRAGSIHLDSSGVTWEKKKDEIETFMETSYSQLFVWSLWKLT